MLCPDTNHLTAKVEEFFLPFRCQAQIWDYNEKLRFQVLDGNNKPLFIMDQISLQHSNDDDLLAIMQQVKSRIITG